MAKPKEAYVVEALRNDGKPYARRVFIGDVYWDRVEIEWWLRRAYTMLADARLFAKTCSERTGGHHRVVTFREVSDAKE